MAAGSAASKLLASLCVLNECMSCACACAMRMQGNRQVQDLLLEGQQVLLAALLCVGRPDHVKHPGLLLCTFACFRA